MSSDEAAPIIVSTEVAVVEDYTGTGGQSDPMTRYILDATTIYGTRLKSIFHAHTDSKAIDYAESWIEKHCKGKAVASLHNSKDELVWELAVSNS